jgi:hypothetical protein
MGRWQVMIRGRAAESTFTKRGAEKVAARQRQHGLDAHVERTNRCPVCRLHDCKPGECPDQ